MSNSPRSNIRTRGAGKDHHVDIKLGSAGPDGTLDFFAERFSFHLKLKKGIPSGSAVVSGDRFAAGLSISPRNTWKLEYTHHADGSTMSISARLGHVTRASDLFEIERKDDRNDIRLQFSKRLGIHGRVETRVGRALRFGLRFTREGATGADLTHKGSAHEIRMKYFTDGSYELKIKVKLPPGKLLIIKKRGEIEASASFSF